MKNTTKNIEHIVWISLLVILMLPALQQYFSIFPVRSLNGAYKTNPKPEFTFSNWMSGKFQDSLTQYLNDNIGFRPIMIRSKNQIEFSLFGKTHASGSIIGKNNWLYEYDYLREYKGEDYIGNSIIDRRIRMFKFLQMHLKKTKNIDLILVLEPNKVSTYPEYLPESYSRHRQTPSNYETYISKIRQYEVRYIDFDAYFREIKDQVSYPLYPQYGIHWSEYGAYLVADSILHYIENLRNIKFPFPIVDSIEVSRIPRSTDFDIGKTLNLLISLSLKQNLAYPVYHFGRMADSLKPMVLTISDSYYWNIFNTRIPKNLYKNEAFWYFNSRVVPDSYFKETKVKELDFRKEIEKQDVIFVMLTNRYLYKFDWGWTSNAYFLYAKYPDYYRKRIMYENNIFGYEQWFNDILEKSMIHKIPLQKQLNYDIDYLYKKDLKNEFLKYDILTDVKKKIKQTPQWFNLIKTKAEKRNISIDSMLTISALYLVNDTTNEKYKDARLLLKAKDKISRDSIKEINTLMQKYYLNRDEAILLLAEKALNN